MTTSILQDIGIVTVKATHLTDPHNALLSCQGIKPMNAKGNTFENMGMFVWFMEELTLCCKTFKRNVAIIGNTDLLLI